MHVRNKKKVLLYICVPFKIKVETVKRKKKISYILTSKKKIEEGIIVWLKVKAWLKVCQKVLTLQSSAS